MSIYKTCPTCGTSTPLSLHEVKEFEGVPLSVAPVLTMPETLMEMVDGIIESTGYGSVD